MDNKLYFATIKSPHGNTQFCEKETRTALCDADHEHMYHVEDGDPSELDPDAQKLLAARHSIQNGESLPEQDEPYGPDHMATVTNIWDAKSLRGRQFPPE